jgi:hypothetical protein
MELQVRYLGILGVFGVFGVWTNEPALYALFALFVLFGSDRTIALPVGDENQSRGES